MAVTFVGTGASATEDDASGTSVTVNFASHLEGDLLIAFINTSNGTPLTNPAPTINALAGWTEIADISNGATSATGLYLAYHIATSDDEILTETFTASETTGYVSSGSVLRGADQTTPIDVIALGTAQGSSLSNTTPAVTTTVDNVFVVRALSLDDNIAVGTTPSPSGYDLRFTHQEAGPGNGVTAFWYDMVEPTSGDTGTEVISWTGDSEENISAVFGIRPEVLTKEDFEVDAIVKALDQEETFLIDAVLVMAEQFTIDARVMKEQTKDFTIDARILGTECKIEVREFTITSGTGNIDFTGFGFQPKACLFIYTPNATQNTDGADMERMLGMCDGTRQWAMSSGAQDGNVNVSRRSTTTGCILHIDVEGSSQVVEGKAEFVSFLSDGVRLNRTTTFISPISPLVKVIAFGGNAVRVHGDIFDPANTINTSASTTALGFEPDLLITGMIGNHVDANSNTNNDDDSWSMGWAVNPDRQASNNQFCIGMEAREGDDQADSNHAIFNNRCCVSRMNASNDTGIEITSFDTNGFTATTRDTSAGTNDRFFFLGLTLGFEGAREFSVNQDTPSSTGSQSQTGTGFTPTFLLGEVIGDNRAFNTWSNSDPDNASIGIGLTDDTRTHSLTAYHDDGSDPPNTATRIRDTHFHSLDMQNGSLLSEATFTSFNSDGWTLDFTTASAVQKAVYLAIGKCVVERSEVFTVDAVLVRDATFTVDARLSALAEFTIDAFVQKTQTFDFTINSLIQDRFTVDVNNIDAIISQPSADKNEPDYFLVIDESTLEVTGDVKEPTGFNIYTQVQNEEIMGFIEWFVNNDTQLSDIFEDLNVDKDTLWKIFQRFEQGGYGADPEGKLLEAMEFLYRLYIEEALPTNFSDDLDFDTRKFHADFRPGD